VCVQIDVALQLFSNSSLSYSSPSSAESFNSISLAIKSGITYGGVILTTGAPNLDQFSISQVENGSLQFQCNENRAILTNEVLDHEQWYQLYATRYVSFLVL